MGIINETGSSFTVLTRAHGGNNDKRFALGFTEMFRPMIIGNDWNEIKLGIRYTIQERSPDRLRMTPNLFLGLCASAHGSGFGARGTGHAVGARYRGNNWLFNDDTPHDYYTSGPQIFGVKKVGSTITETASGINTSASTPAGITATHCFFVNLLKGSPNWTINAAYGTNINHRDSDLTQTDFIAMMDEDIGLEGNVLPGYNDGTARTLAVDESADGNVNAVNVGFSAGFKVILELSGIAYRKVS